MILIIENNLNISNNFKERLDFYNLNYKIVNCGVDAYKIICEDRPRLAFEFIITNLGLPDENGFEIIKFANTKYDTKIVIYSSKPYIKYFDEDIIKDIYIFDKKDKTPQEIIDMIISGEIS